MKLSSILAQKSMETEEIVHPAGICEEHGEEQMPPE